MEIDANKVIAQLQKQIGDYAVKLAVSEVARQQLQAANDELVSQLGAEE